MMKWGHDQTEQETAADQAIAPSIKEAALSNCVNWSSITGERFQFDLSFYCSLLVSEVNVLLNTFAYCQELVEMAGW